MPLRKQLGLFDLTMIVVSFVIGMGIFRTPANVAAATPSPAIFFLCWLCGGFVALCGALLMLRLVHECRLLAGV